MMAEFPVGIPAPQLAVHKTLFVGNLSYFCEERNLLNLFSTYGPVESVEIKRGRDTGDCLMHGFVEMCTYEAADAAANDLRGRKFMGRRIRVSRGNGRSIDNERDSWVQLHVSFVSRQLEILITEEIVDAAFSTFGEVTDCVVKRHRITTESQHQSGYGFVYFADRDVAVRTLFHMKHTTVQGVVYDCTVSYKSEQMIAEHYRYLTDAGQLPPPMPQQQQQPLPQQLPQQQQYSIPMMNGGMNMNGMNMNGVNMNGMNMNGMNMNGMNLAMNGMLPPPQPNTSPQQRSPFSATSSPSSMYRPLYPQAPTTYQIYEPIHPPLTVSPPYMTQSIGQPMSLPQRYPRPNSPQISYAMAPHPHTQPTLLQPPTIQFTHAGPAYPNAYTHPPPQYTLYPSSVATNAYTAVPSPPLPVATLSPHQYYTTTNTLSPVATSTTTSATTPSPTDHPHTLSPPELAYGQISYLHTNTLPTTVPTEVLDYGRNNYASPRLTYQAMYGNVSTTHPFYRSRGGPVTNTNTNTTMNDPTNANMNINTRSDM